MAFDPKHYHPEWKSIARQIRDQAGDKCETCGVPNGLIVVRNRRNPMHWYEMTGTGENEADEGAWVAKIVLTVHHRCDCDKRVCHDPSHLVALCQLHHLQEDRPHHLAVQQANRIAKRLAAPLPLFEGVE